MNLLLHHFLKEFRYLRSRWFAWISVLIMQLAVDAEWIAPLSVASAAPAWIGLLPMLMWGGAAVLALAYAPEDARADDCSFIAVRPLPRACYWWSRVAVFGLLIAMPMVLQEGVYLLCSGRPAADVLLGMWERFFITGACIAWLLPMPLMAKGWHRFTIAAVAVISGLLAKSVSVTLLRRTSRLSHEMFYTSNSLFQAAWAGALLMLMLAWWQKRHGWSLSRTLTFTAVVSCTSYALAWTPLMQPWSWTPREPALITEIERKYGELPQPQKYRFYESTSEESTPELVMDGELMPLEGLPPQINPHWRNLGGEMRIKDVALTGKTDGYFKRRFFFLPAIFMKDDPWLIRTLQSALEPETLSMGSSSGHRAMPTCKWPIPVDRAAPADVELNFEADWVRQTVLGECELRPGARVRSDYCEMEVLQVIPHQDADGKEQRGSVTLVFKQSKREIETGGTPFEYFSDVWMVLRAPAKRLLWQQGQGALPQMRGFYTGWQRHLSRWTFKDVLTSSSGLTEADLPTLRVMLRKQDYTGTSRHQLKLKQVSLTDPQSEKPWAYPTHPPRVAETARLSVQHEFTRIRTPAADASREEVARFLADVVTLSHAYSYRSDLKKDGSPWFPGNDHAIADAVARHLLRHPQVITRLPHLIISAENTFMRELLDAMLLASGIPGIKRESNGLIYEPPNGSSSTRRLLNDIENIVGGWQAMAPAIEQALRDRDLSPILAVHAKWRSEVRQHRSDEELLKYLRERFSVSTLWELRGRETALKQAREMIRAEYERRVPPRIGIDSELRPLAECAIVAGMEVALDRRLRGLRFWNEKEMDHEDVMDLSILSRSFSGGELKWVQGLEFLRQAREWRAADFSYDSATLTWRRKTNP